MRATSPARAARYPMSLERPVHVPDGAGGATCSWEPLGTLWAGLRALGAPRDEGGAVPSISTRWRVTVRAAEVGAPSRPVPGQRLRLGERIFAVEAVREREGDPRYLDCDAIEEVPS